MSAVDWSNYRKCASCAVEMGAQCMTMDDTPAETPCGGRRRIKAPRTDFVAVTRACIHCARQTASVKTGECGFAMCIEARKRERRERNRIKRVAALGRLS